MCGQETPTSIESAVVSVAHVNPNAPSNRAPMYGKLEVLEWGQNPGYELDTLEKDDIVDTAMDRHLEVEKCLRKLGIK